MPGFAWGWPLFSGFTLSLFQLQCRKKVKPASNAGGLDTKCIEDILFSFFWFNDFPSALGCWESDPHIPQTLLYFSKGQEALLQDTPLPLPPSCERGLRCEPCQLRGRDSRGLIPKEIPFPNPASLELEGRFPLCT